MDYSGYHQGRQENRPHLETSRAHHPPQHAVHYQHQQYPTPHHAMQAGYPGLGPFGPYMNPLHSSGPVLAQSSGPDGLHSPSPRLASSETNNSSLGGRVVVQMANQDFQSVMAAGLHVATSVPHQPQSENATPDPDYRIQDLSNTSHNPAATSARSINSPQSSGSSVNSTRTVQPRVAGGVTQGNRKKGRAPRQKTPASVQEAHSVGGLQPASQVLQQRMDRANVVQSFSRGCQTDPLFEVPQERAEQAAVTVSPDALPEGLCFGEVSDTRTKNPGVFATKDLEAGERFGPFTGDFVKEGLGCYNPSTWEICVKGRTWFYIDGSTDPSNWMTKVEVARSREEQNLEAFQFYGNIFFCTTKPVAFGAELRVFYSEEYSVSAGFGTGLEDLHVTEDLSRFECQDCNCRYSNAKSLLRHLKFEHDKENNPVVKDDAAKDSKLTTEREKSAWKMRLYLSNRDKVKVGGEKRKTEKEVTSKPNVIPKVESNQQPEMVRLRKRGRRKAEPKKLYVCKKCGKQFPSEGRLKEHVAFHTEMVDLKLSVTPVCDICGLECKGKRALKQHMLSHDSNAHQCHHCKKYFPLKRYLIYHLRRDHNESIGGKWIRGSVEEYLSRYVGPGGEEDEEQEPFHPELPKDMLGKRILVASKKPKVFKCKYCPKKFVGRSQVLWHEKVTHTNSGKYKCEFCPANFMEEQRYILHQRKHTKDRPYKCEDCSESFASEKALENHRGEHRGERPHRCDVCGKGFRTRKNMTCHRRRQHSTSMTLVKCSFCDKTFKDKKSAARHEMRHKGIRPFVCLTCGKAFVTKYSLQQHAHVHTGERPFECKVCQQRFSLNHHLVAHLLRHEKEKIADSLEGTSQTAKVSD